MNRKAATLLEAFDGLGEGAVIVEIGCVRQSHEVASDGYSTVYLAQAARDRGWHLFSVDIDERAVEIAREVTEGLPVHLSRMDGADFLENVVGNFEPRIDGLYLDGAAEPEQTLGQYLAANLAEHCVVAIDDMQDIGDIRGGKGGLLIGVLADDGFTVEIKDTEPGYRMAVAAR